MFGEVRRVCRRGFLRIAVIGRRFRKKMSGDSKERLLVDVSSMDTTFRIPINVRSSSPTSKAASTAVERSCWIAPQVVITHERLPKLDVVTILTASKDPDLQDSNEDLAIWLADRQTAAVLDGATESFAAQRWVTIVGEQWRQETNFDLKLAQERYAQEVGELPLDWAQDQAAQRGSFTTFASVEPAKGGLKATVIGDSAILLLKNDEIRSAYPFSLPGDYTSVPDALPSRDDLLTAGLELWKSGTWIIPLEPASIDCVILATDAVAVWLLVENMEERTLRIHQARQCADNDEWAELVLAERAAGKIKSDDSTMVVLRIEIVP